ncbi:MAG: NYN domain-containing protein [Methanomassiliicoccales archaeon]
MYDDFILNFTSNSQVPLAILIDGDNVSHEHIQKIIEEASKFGQVMTKRVYGNWKSTTMQGWSNEVQDYAITPIQVFSNVKRKNATDSSLIIDAMDILHDGVIEGFCIVSSDSDYTSLALRIKEHGKFVMGIGSESTHKSFTNACTKFIKIENIVEPKVDGASDSKKPNVIKKNGNEIVTIDAVTKDEELKKILINAYDSVAATSQVVHLAALGVFISKIHPGFDYRNYDVSKFRDLFLKFPDVFALHRQEDQNYTVTKNEEKK